MLVIELLLPFFIFCPRRLRFIAAGLVHGLTPCGNCPGGPYDNMENNMWNYIANWISTRFGM